MFFGFVYFAFFRLGDTGFLLTFVLHFERNMNVTPFRTSLLIVFSTQLTKQGIKYGLILVMF